MAGKFWTLKIQPMNPFKGFMCPTVIHDFPVPKLGTERMPKFQIYFYNNTIATSLNGPLVL